MTPVATNYKSGGCILTRSRVLEAPMGLDLFKTFPFLFLPQLYQIITRLCVLPAQDLISLLDPEQNPPFFSTMALGLDLDCFPELGLQAP